MAARFASDRIQGQRTRGKPRFPGAPALDAHLGSAPIALAAIGFAILPQLPVVGQTLGDYLDPVEVTAEARVVLRSTQDWPSVPDLEWNGSVDSIFDGRNFFLRCTEQNGSSEYLEYDLAPLSDSTAPPGVSFRYLVRGGSLALLNGRGTRQHAAPDLAIQALMPMFYWWANAHAEYHPTPTSHRVAGTEMEFTTEDSTAWCRFQFVGDRPSTMKLGGPAGVTAEANFSGSCPGRPSYPSGIEFKAYTPNSREVAIHSIVTIKSVRAMGPAQPGALAAEVSSYVEIPPYFAYNPKSGKATSLDAPAGGKGGRTAASSSPPPLRRHSAWVLAGLGLAALVTGLVVVAALRARNGRKARGGRTTG